MKEGLWIIEKYSAMLCSWFPRNWIWKLYVGVCLYTYVCVCVYPQNASIFNTFIFNICIHIYI